MVVSAPMSHDVDLKAQRVVSIMATREIPSLNIWKRIVRGACEISSRAMIPKLRHREGTEVEVAEEKAQKIGEILETK